MIKKLIISGVIVAITLAIPAIPASATVYATDDTVVRAGYPTSPGGGFNWTSSGDGEGLYRLWVKFALPALVPGTCVDTAMLYGYYYQDTHGGRDVVHNLYAVSDDNWTEGNLTWNTQPLQSTWSLAGTWDSAPCTPLMWVSWDVSSAVNQEYLGDGVISFLMRPDNEIQWTGEQFRTKEYTTTDLRWHIEITTKPCGPQVPEWSSIMLAGMGLLPVAGFRMRRRSK